MLKHAVNVPEAQEFGASDFAFHHADYPTYRRKGWDIGSDPTEAALRALYVSGGRLWDGFWSGPRRATA
jgi:hypothetical protein